MQPRLRQIERSLLPAAEPGCPTLGNGSGNPGRGPRGRFQFGCSCSENLLGSQPPFSAAPCLPPIPSRGNIPGAGQPLSPTWPSGLPFLPLADAAANDQPSAGGNPISSRRIAFATAGSGTGGRGLVRPGLFHVLRGRGPSLASATDWLPAGSGPCRHGSTRISPQGH